MSGDEYLFGRINIMYLEGELFGLQIIFFFPG